jgi:hypothetical protein
MDKTSNFIEKSKNIHGDLFDYKNVEYINNKTNVELICKEHGSFFIRPDSHLSKKYGCPDCGIRRRVENSKNKNWLQDCMEVHGDRYDYSNVSYVNNKEKVEIICKEHGTFLMKMNAHLGQKQNCPKCYRVFNTEDFISKSNKVHNCLYDYSKSVYIDAREKVVVICKEHQEFDISPYCHLQGQGCNKCRLSKGENRIYNLLKEKGINYKVQYMFNDCVNIKKLPFDFYLPEQNICIEYDGLQHFKPIDYFGGVKSFNELKQRDSIKDKYCLENNIKLIRIPFDKYDFIDDILISEINN